MLCYKYRMPSHRRLLSIILGNAGANLVVMKSTAWDRMVSVPLVWMYRRLFSDNLNRDRNLDLLRTVRDLVIWPVIWILYSVLPYLVPWTI